MIYIDYRQGSKEFKKYIANSDITELEFADFMFYAKVDDKRISVGIERKTISEMIGSVLGDKRFVGHQLPGMLQEYDKSYLIVEGRYQPDKNGLLSIPYKSGWRPLTIPKTMMWRTFDNHLHSVSSRGIMILLSNSTTHTAQRINSLKWWYSRGNHSSADGYYFNTAPSLTLNSKRSRFLKMISCLPGIGQKKLIAVANHFGTMKQLVNSTADQWTEIDGIGKKTAEQIIKELGE